MFLDIRTIDSKVSKLDPGKSVKYSNRFFLTGFIILSFNLSLIQRNKSCL